MHNFLLMTTHKPFYENKLRNRVCGLCFKNDSILLVKHNLNGKAFYAPPGGAIEFGESIAETLIRELKEETTIDVVAASFLFITEYINPPLHAIEHFYHIKSYKGTPTLGNDPETDQIEIIQGVSFYSAKDLKQIKRSELHHIFHICDNPKDILKLSGIIEAPKKL